MASPVPWGDARALLTAAGLGVSLAWPNEPFTEPAGDPPALWVAVEDSGNNLAPLDVGGRVWQEEGTLYCHVMAPSGTGTDAARTLAKQIANVFRGLGARDVVYRSASIGDGGLSDTDGLWWRLTVSVDWIYQDTT